MTDNNAENEKEKNLNPERNVQPQLNKEESKDKLTQNPGDGGKMEQQYEENKEKFSSDNPGERKETSEHEPADEELKD